MNNKLIALLFILSLPVLVLAFPSLGRKSPTYYAIPGNYVAFPADTKFNFEKHQINYPHFYQYGLDMRWFVLSLSQGGDEILEGSTALARTSAMGTLVYDKKNIHYLGVTASGQHVYQTPTYLHLSVYVSYQLSYFDEKKESFMDLGNSKIYTTIPPETYKTIAPNLEID